MYKLLFKDHKVGVDLWLSKKSLFESFVRQKKTWKWAFSPFRRTSTCGRYVPSLTFPSGAYGTAIIL